MSGIDSSAAHAEWKQATEAALPAACQASCSSSGLVLLQHSTAQHSRPLLKGCAVAVFSRMCTAH